MPKIILNRFDSPPAGPPISLGRRAIAECLSCP